MEPDEVVIHFYEDHEAVREVLQGFGAVPVAAIPPLVSQPA
jgi:hypothetical protein